MEGLPKENRERAESPTLLGQAEKKEIKRKMVKSSDDWIAKH